MLAGEAKKSGRVKPKEEMNPTPQKMVELKINHLIFVRKVYRPNLGPLGPPIVTWDTVPGEWGGVVANCDYIA